jgi:hypothetical protein
MLKTLNTVSRLRRFAVDEARQTLAACLHAEAIAAEAEKSAEAAMRREGAAAACLSADDATVEAFAAWLPRGRQALGVARERHERASAATFVARAKMAAALTAAAVIDRLRQTRMAEQQTTADRVAQATLDEIAQTHRRRTQSR